MNIKFAKYHALQNDFIVVEQAHKNLSSERIALLAEDICNRHSGVGADGLLYLSADRESDGKVDVYNSDGGWAERSGNGLRIVALHEGLKNRRKKRFLFKMGGTICPIAILGVDGQEWKMKTDLAPPCFETSEVPVKSRSGYLINAPLDINGTEFPVTCLSVGNPHTVLFVDDFDFDWQALGADIEKNKAFPNGTNVEFVKAVSRKKLIVADWERGAGSTGSSGTGAAAAVVAAVTIGAADRACEVVFNSGSLFINWRDKDNVIELTGPAEPICSGVFEWK